MVVTFFLTGREKTLPLLIWGRLRQGISPEINAGGDRHHRGVAGRRASLEPALETGGRGRLDKEKELETAMMAQTAVTRTTAGFHLDSWDGPASSCGTSPSSSGTCRR